MRSSDVNVEATQHPVSCPGSGSDFINLNRSVERSSAWLTHPGSQRGENSAFGKVASSLSYLIKDLFIFRAEEISVSSRPHKVLVSGGRCFDRHSRDSWSFEESGADTALAGERRWFPHRSSSRTSHTQCVVEEMCFSLNVPRQTGNVNFRHLKDNVFPQQGC